MCSSEAVVTVWSGKGAGWWGRGETATPVATVRESWAASAVNESTARITYAVSPTAAWMTDAHLVLEVREPERDQRLAGARYDGGWWTVESVGPVGGNATLVAELRLADGERAEVRSVARGFAESGGPFLAACESRDVSRAGDSLHVTASWTCSQRAPLATWLRSVPADAVVVLAAVLLCVAITTIAKRRT